MGYSARSTINSFRRIGRVNDEAYEDVFESVAGQAREAPSTAFFDDLDVFTIWTSLYCTQLRPDLDGVACLRIANTGKDVFVSVAGQGPI